MYKPRAIEDALRRATAKFPALVVTGARQVGKSTVLQHLATSDRTVVTLDDPDTRELAVREPAVFLQRFAPPVMIDEIQNAPGLMPYVKMAIDRDRSPGRFWLTGSQVFHLMKGVSESLAGRVAVFSLAGLSHRELVGRLAGEAPFLPGGPAAASFRSDGIPVLSLGDLYATIWRGSLPGLALFPDVDRDLYYASYVETYLQRDVRHLARVGDELSFLRFLRAAAARTAQLLNLSDLARDADVAVNTAKAWLSILRTSGLVHLLEPWHANVAKRLVKSPKLHFLDTGLASWLTGWSSPRILESGAMSGAMLETWAVGEVLKSYWNAGLPAPAWFYRDTAKHEIDLLIHMDGILYPVEIKKTARPRPDDVRAFQHLKALGLPVGPGALLCLVPESMPIDRDNSAWPVGSI